ncbi:MAG: hypothetical protein PHC88_07685 [Terrimicrobiaceae bacterium]|nr:hypothetical protein [Terrimicrobiaceae bacterium]
MRPEKSSQPAGWPARGSALISTLLVIVVLTIVAVAFLQSMTMERQAARGYLNRYLAESAARAGLADAMRRLENGAGDSQFHFVVATENPDTIDERLALLTLNPGKTTVRKEIALASVPGEAGASTNSFKLDLTPQATKRTQRTVAWRPLNDAKGREVARYGFWVDAAGSKQDARMHSGIKNPHTHTESGSKRDALQTLAEVPLVASDGTVFSPGQSTPLRAYQYFTDAKDRIPLLTAASINQVAVPSPGASERDFTIDVPAALLTPEGKPRLNLQRLKCYIDGDPFEEPGEEFDGDGKPIPIESVAYPGLPVDQGPTKPRFELVKQLLNEDGTHPPETKNPWGYGNLEIVTRILPATDANGTHTQARQFVANLLDYIDSDIIPTSDGDPGPAPSSGSVSGQHPSLEDFVLPAQPAPPTVLGVEARLDPGGGIRGHPYITYVGQGFIFNSASTRVLGWTGMAYPWSATAKMGSGSSTYYQVEMQVGLAGSASGGRGPRVMSERSSDPQGYFLHGWLAQESNFRGEYRTREFAPRSYILFPRGWSGSQLDMANGYFSCGNPMAVTFTNLASKIEVLRLIYKDPVRQNQRCLVQDLGALSALPRQPRNFTPSTALVKLGQPGYSAFSDWHYLGDPRLNFQKPDSTHAEWVLASTILPATSSDTGAKGVLPAGNADIYHTPLNNRKDPLQGMDVMTNKWLFNQTGLINHFPAAIDPTKSNIGYRPSPSGGKDAQFYGEAPAPAMLSCAELGFIHAGAPWQTLTLFNDPERFKDSDLDHADWLLLDYIDIGTPPRHLNAAGQREVYGQINGNTGNRTTLRALLQDVGDVASPARVIDQVLASARRPFVEPAAIFSEPGFKNDLANDSDRERFVGQMYPALTAHSQKFTVYSAGEARDNGRTLSHVTLAADVELRYEKQADGTQQLKPRVLRTYIP